MTPEFETPEMLDESAQLTADAAEFETALMDQVEVQTERAEGRQRVISARIQIPHPIEQVWGILTDYDHLADFIPNLSKSRQIDHPQGGIRIEQIGTQSLLRLKFCARVVLDMLEQFPNRLAFQMVEGDFKIFQGSWTLHPVTLAEGDGTDLVYAVTVLPPRAMPVGMIERRLKQGLVVNLSAIRRRADELFG
jgi:ribosome-associated toxin RatA of RatAB toxin-antitoxin module